MKPLFIVNEYAGKGKTRRCWFKIHHYLQKYGIQHEVHFTSRPREAIEIAKQAASGKYLHVVAVGGDGTINEVVNGLTGQKTILGVIPTGTGNDFARMLDIPSDPLLAIKRFVNGSPKYIDVIELNGRYIAGAIGIGYDGAIAEDMNRASWKKKLGTFGYVLSMLKLLYTFPPFTLHLDIDGQSIIFYDCWLVAIGNSRFYGGGMIICPDAKHDDGLLDVCVVHGLSRVELLRIFPTVFSGKHVLHPKVSYLQGKVVHVQTDPVVPVHGDGERFGETPGKISIRPQALSIMY